MGDTLSTVTGVHGDEEFVAAIANHPSKQALYDTMEFTKDGVFGEKDRYSAIESLKMLDTPANEQPFDRITQMMTKVFKTPVSLITLVADPTRVWFKSKVGPFGACVDRDGSWCNYVLVPSTPEVLITEDATKDARLAHNPYVAGEPYIKFYAGAPLVGSKGERYGTLCIVDLKQRAFTAELYSLLINFAALAVEEIERHKPLYELATGMATNDVERNRHLDLSVTAYKEGVVMVDVREAGWPISYANPSFETSSGLELDDLAGEDFWEVFECPRKDELDLAAIVGKGEEFETGFFCNKSKRWMTMRLMPATTDRFSPSKATAIPGWVPSVDCPQGTSRLGFDVEPEKVVDTANRDIMDVPDAKCFWFAVIVASSPAVSEMGSTAASTGGYGSLNSATTSGGSAGGASVSSFGSAFGEYMPPASLGEVQMGPLLGSGSFGKVYRCITDDKPAAVKVIDCRGRDRGMTSNQMEEVQRSSDLDHPRVVKMLKHGTSTVEQKKGGHMSVVWIIQELCDMGQLSDAQERGWLRVKRTVTDVPDMNQVLPTMRDIADAMSYVHSKNIIHADLTSRNVLLASDANDPRGFVAKVADFGLAKVMQDAEPMHMNILGTITHMPPELLSKNELCPLGDVWAFGVVSWECYHGKKVYCGKAPPQIIMTVIKNNPLPMVGAPQPLVDFMKKVMSYDRSGRPQFSAIVEELDALIAKKMTVEVEPSDHLMATATNHNPPTEEEK